MALLEDNVMALAARAGWKKPARDGDGAWRFHLEHDLRFTALSPDDRLCVLRAEIATLPEPGPDRDALTADALRRQAGVCRVRASVVALERPDSWPGAGTRGERLILHRSFALPAEQERFDAEVGAFLNDLAWWKASCGGSRAAPPGPALFGMGSGFFLPGGRF